MHTQMTKEEIQEQLELSYTARREQRLMATEEGKGSSAKNSRSFNIIQSDIYFAIKEDVAEFVRMKTESKGRKMPFFRDVVIPYVKQYKKDAKKYGEKNLQKSPAEKIITYFLSELLTQHAIFEERSKIDTATKICAKLRFQLNDPDCWNSDIPEEYMVATFGLVNIAVASCEFLEEVGGTNAGGNSIPVTIVLEESYAKKIGDIKEALKARLTPMEPMIAKPRHHRDLISTHGGYYTTPSPLLKNPIKVNKRIHQSILDCNDETNPDLFRILNKMQDTAYRVDTEFLSLIPDLFKYINEVDDSEEDKKYDTSNRIVDDTILMARTYAGYSEIYYPMFVDNRGRMYPYASNGLSYQSDDLGKSLVEYAEGRKLDDAGVDALKFALGEYLGVAKVVGPRRMKVVEDALPTLLKQYENRDWSFIKGDDAPFGFISIVKELYNFYKDPEYICHKVLHNDACSSGLQLIGLFTQDKMNLKITNVLNPEEDKLEDLYLITAAANKERILEKNKNRSENTEAYNKMLDIILKYPEVLEDRAVVKTPSMTFYNYGAKQTSVYQNIVEKMWSKYRPILMELIEEEIDDIRVLFISGSGTLKTGKYPVVGAFCQNVWDSMQTANPTAVAAQKWMGELIKHDIKRQDCFSFVNPLTGFPVVLRKPEYATEEVQSVSLVPVRDKGETKWVGKKIRHVMHRPTNKIKTTKTVTSSIPGMIHAADGGVMVLICDKLGYVTGIHDSAGCHPNDVPKLREAVAMTLYECATCRYYERIQEECEFSVNPPMVNTVEDLNIIKETLYAFA